ncbi:MAG: homoserine dehydrogenase, partial [Nocardioides sp.]|nr:homoserine dehydrogenase [Nocardioides sp.]
MFEGQKPLKVAVLGCGSVGSQVVRLLTEQAGDLAARVGTRVELAGVAVRRIDAPREVDVPEGLLTTDAAGLVSREDIDLVIEVIGGIEPARSLILSALEHGASVVTANKA